MVANVISIFSLLLSAVDETIDWVEGANVFLRVLIYSSGIHLLFPDETIDWVEGANVFLHPSNLRPSAAVDGGVGTTDGAG